MKDYADRTWAKDPYSTQWRDAWLKAWKHENSNLQPKVGLCRIAPRIAVMFQRSYTHK